MKSVICCVVGMLWLSVWSSATAHADPEVGLSAKTEFLPEQLVRRPLVLSHGMVELSVHTEASLATDANFQPVSVAPDLRYGLTDRLTIGLIHSNQAVGNIGNVGNGICLAGTANRCAHLYNQTGFEGIYSLRAGQSRWHAALRGYAMLSGHGDTVPFGVTSAVGVRARWRDKRLALRFDPTVGVAFRRSGDTDVLAQLYGEAQYQVAARFAVYAGVGYYGPVDDFGAVPISSGMLFAVDENIDIAAAVAFVDIADSADARSLTVSFSYRM